jgi:HPt (histidine-containing phosphotransfer) domain-containing protein
MSAIDLTYLESVTDGDKDLIKELIDIFKVQVPEYMEEFTSAFSEKDIVTLGRIAHKAKSTVAIMGLSDLADELRELEEFSREGPFKEEYQKYITNFEIACKDAIQQLDKLI